MDHAELLRLGPGRGADGNAPWFRNSEGRAPPFGRRFPGRNFRRVALASRRSPS